MYTRQETRCKSLQYNLSEPHRVVALLLVADANEDRIAITITDNGRRIESGVDDVTDPYILVDLETAYDIAEVGQLPTDVAEAIVSDIEVFRIAE